jgi:hypothetical protein
MKSSTTMRRLLPLLALVTIASMPLRLSASTTFHITETDEVLTTDIPGAIIGGSPDNWIVFLPGAFFVSTFFNSPLSEPENLTPDFGNLVTGTGPLIFWQSDIPTGIPGLPSVVTVPGQITEISGGFVLHDLVLADIKSPRQDSSVPDTTSSILLLGLSVLGLCGFRSLQQSKI